MISTDEKNGRQKATKSGIRLNNGNGYIDESKLIDFGNFSANQYQLKDKTANLNIASRNNGGGVIAAMYVKKPKTYKTPNNRPSVRKYNSDLQNEDNKFIVPFMMDLPTGQITAQNLAVNLANNVRPKSRSKIRFNRNMSSMRVSAT